MLIEDGVVVTYEQAYHSAEGQLWGKFLRVTVFPKTFDEATTEKLRGLTEGAVLQEPVSVFDDLEYDETLLFKVPKSSIKGSAELKVGMVFQTTKLFNSAYNLPAVLIEINDDDVLMDCNQPLLKQKNMLSSIYIRSLRVATPQELTSFTPISNVVV